ncbi:efflux RND transporter periplasmic adaptor subunit [Aliiglaciecola sp. CAU 1673]|uniref:efflux RND transporter periplasmic adaptor subunit n=1 Tax=Aliiglaciecola sp. CAU 1673 TaxID=3032595 RepID=UPI0023DB2276|nr:efflux RND transporter periplasmic adaptor subunit [Aliiglaciecola sp. CAU 1673]MDF2177382.1 efflux RND transporter periplasmic adaptor subunit [Aliiglaciecola sp. CAU 1673]
MKIFFPVLVASLTLALLSPPSVQASGEHGHQQAHAKAHAEAQPEGPRGGKLLKQGDIALELTIFENGVPPELRVYAYQQGQILSPDSIHLKIELERLGGVTDTLHFRVEEDYLVSAEAIDEPHSFDINVAARIQGKDYHWQLESHEGRTTLSARAIAAAGIETATAGPGELAFKESLFGVIAPTTDRRFTPMAPYPGIIEAVLVTPGDKVKKGQPLMRIKNSQTLQRYVIDSPADGIVSEQYVNAGELAGEQELLEIVDLSKVWVELSAFPANIEAMAVGQRALVYDLHQHLQAEGEVFYLAPMMSGGHIARARLLIDNKDGHWRPGMHVKADIITGNRAVALVVAQEAIQSFLDKPVVFVRFGNTFEMRMLTLGQRDSHWVEVLGGLAPGSEYVTKNSYVLKADVLKSGASHDH